MENQTIVQKTFIKIMGERVQNIAWNKARVDEFYIQADKTRNIAFDLLSESLTTDKQRYLLDELESARNFVEGLMQEYAYRQGLQDSQMIHRELAACGISVAKDSFNMTDTF